ncbi:MAG: GNAT family protein [Pricia sp.]
MLSLQGEHIRLRALEPEDLDFLYELENKTAIWEISGTTTPYSKGVLKKYLENAHLDIYEVKQLRLAICRGGDGLEKRPFSGRTSEAGRASGLRSSKGPEATSAPDEMKGRDEADEYNEPLGLIDLFDFDPKNRRTGLGIIVLEKENRNRGIGSETIRLLTEYAFSVLDLRQVYANVIEGNSASVHLFEKLGFERAGVKKDWIFSKGIYKDEILYQKRNVQP